MKKFSDYQDIYDFYQQTGMDRYQAYEFLKKELEVKSNGKRIDAKILE